MLIFSFLYFRGWFCLPPEVCASAFFLENIGEGTYLEKDVLMAELCSPKAPRTSKHFFQEGSIPLVPNKNRPGHSSFVFGVSGKTGRAHLEVFDSSGIYCMTIRSILSIDSNSWIHTLDQRPKRILCRKEDIGRFSVV